MSPEQASFFYQPAYTHYLCAVYEDTNPTQLLAIAKTLTAISGVVLLQPQTMHGEATQGTEIPISIYEIDNRQQIIQYLKDTLQPILPITVTNLGLIIPRCSTKRHNLMKARFKFLEGFEPPKRDIYMLSMMAKMSSMPFTDAMALYQEGEPFSPLLDSVIRAALRRQRTHLQSISFEVRTCCKPLA